MKRLLSTCLLMGALLSVFCLPAQARLVVGVAPSTPLSRVEQASLDRLSEQLGSAMGTEVSLRRFESSDVLANWLLRFMELDAALVETDFVKHVPAGTLDQIADLHPKDRSQSPVFSLVVRRIHDSAQIEALRKAFVSLDASSPGRKLLDQLQIEGVTAPGEVLKKKIVKAAPPKPPKAEAAPPAPKIPAAASKPEPTAPKPAEAPASLPDSPAVTSPAPMAVPSQPAAEPSKPPAPAAETQPATIAPEKPKAAEPVTAQVKKDAPDAAVKPAPAISQKESSRTEPASPKASTDRRLVLFAALLILAAILLKAILFTLRWRTKRQGAATRPDTPPVDPFASDQAAPVARTTTPTPAATPAAPALDEAEEELVVESGRLGPGKVPALLKRCADLPKPVMLSVSKGACEKLVFFAGGKVSGALTQNTGEAESAMRWKKLGSLLVREGLITTEELQQGLDLLDRQPGLRLGEALLKLGHIDLVRLRHALTRQAKVTLYSLILFPEGNYKVVAGDGRIPPEESVALEINALIKEAATHQVEWTTIRQTLPNLNMVLDYTPSGRSKVSNVSLSPLQESILSLVSGQRTISDLCSESSMMDYEVYRFLYMMVKAGVLDKKAS